MTSYTTLESLLAIFERLNIDDSCLFHVLNQIKLALKVEEIFELAWDSNPGTLVIEVNALGTNCAKKTFQVFGYFSGIKSFTL